MSGATVLTTFYDRPGPNSSQTRVTARSFILASNSEVTYLPPKMWPQKKLSEDALAAGHIISPVNISDNSTKTAAKTRKITTDKLDLTGLDVPSFNQYIYMNGLISVAINEPSAATIKLNGKTYKLNGTIILLFYHSFIEFILMFVNASDFKDQIHISLPLLLYGPATEATKYFNSIGTAPGNTKGVSPGNLFKDLSGGAYTYLGSSIIPQNNGAVDPVTWYVFENGVNIAEKDFIKLWSVIDPSGVMFAGAGTSTIPNTTDVYYLPESQIFRPVSKDAQHIISAGQCKLVRAVEYYDPKTGKLTAGVEGNTFVPVASIMNPSAPDEKWMKDAPSGGSTATIEIPGISHAVESTIAVIIGIIVSCLIAFSVWKVVEYRKLPVTASFVKKSAI